MVARLPHLLVERPNSLNRRVLAWTVGATLAAFSSGCHSGGTVSTKTTVPQSAKPVVRDATRAELLDKYNQIAQGVKTVNATVELKPTAGSKYSGVIEEYHEVKAFLLAARPAEASGGIPHSGLRGGATGRVDHVHDLLAQSRGQRRACCGSRR